MSSTTPHRPHIVVLGAGFGGLTFAKKFPDGLAHVTVVDRTNHHLFQPLLYQVATAGLAVPDVAQPVRSILTRKDDVTVLMNEVTAIDLDARRVSLADSELTYDYLILAIGGCTSYFGHPEWEEHAPGLKSIEDAIRIRREVLGAFERAEMTDDPAERERLTTIIVVGGGATGVELAGTFAELQRTVLSRDFRRVRFDRAKVILLEAGDRVLDPYPKRLSQKAREQLESLGVKLMLNTRVQDIRPGEVVTDKGTLRAANILWGAGVQAVSLTRTLGVETDRAGRLKVQPDLSLPGHPEVLALGDIVTLVDPKKQVVPGVAPAAIQQGKHTALNIERALAGQPLRAFKYRDKGSLATIGRAAAVADFGRVRFGGFFAWMAWLLIHILFLIGFRNRFLVIIQWAWAYFTFQRGARLITGTDRHDADRGKKRA